MVDLLSPITILAYDVFERTLKADNLPVRMVSATERNDAINRQLLDLMGCAKVKL